MIATAAPPRPTWEHQTLATSGPADPARLAGLARAGWTLYSTAPPVSSEDDQHR
jgi:hypothetical protein